MEFTTVGADVATCSTASRASAEAVEVECVGIAWDGYGGVVSDCEGPLMLD